LEIKSEAIESKVSYDFILVGFDDVIIAVFNDVTLFLFFCG